MATDPTPLLDHLAAAHGVTLDAGATYGEAFAVHDHEHNLPYGTRDHDVAERGHGDVAVPEDGCATLSAAEGEWAALSDRLTLERVAIAASIGAESLQHISLTAVPHDADIDDTTTERRFYVDAEEAIHGPGGVTTGLREVRWELSLTRVGATGWTRSA